MSVRKLSFGIEKKPLHEIEADYLIIPAWEEQPLDGIAQQLDQHLGADVANLIAQKDFAASASETFLIPMPKQLKAKRILLLGLGRLAKIDRAKLFDATATAFHLISKQQRNRIVVAFPSGLSVPLGAAARSMAVGAWQGCISSGIHFTKPKRFLPEQIAFLLPDGASESALAQSLDQASIEAENVTMTRHLVNTPPSELYPETFANLIANAASELKIECEIWDERRLEAERMSAILGVAKGSTNPARLAILRYHGKPGTPVLSYVGKGVTFDSGGLSIKTSEQMADMKCDMAGAATVFAATKAIAALKIPVNLLTIMPLVENMPSGVSMKLGDVLRARNGKTIEVLNTDAEGRLILSDALAYAAEQKAARIVDLATLTGSCMVALGTETAGLMTNNENWGSEVLSAIRGAGERAWQLPMDESFDEMLTSKVADMKNIPPARWGGAIAGGKFLQQFVGDVPWVHLDIAGPAWSDTETGAHDAGGTGAYVRSLIELATRFAKG